MAAAITAATSGARNQCDNENLRNQAVNAGIDQTANQKPSEELKVANMAYQDHGESQWRWRNSASARMASKQQLSVGGGQRRRCEQ